MTYFVKLTEGNSTGNYNIYFDNITQGNTNLMTVVATNTLATNLTLEQLLQGIEVSAPVIPNKVIVYGIECDVALNLTFSTSTPVTVPPIYCVTYLTNTQETLQLIPETSLYNGEIQWITIDGTKRLRWNPFYNGGVGRWEMSVDTNLQLVNEIKVNGLPDGNWFFVGSVTGIAIDTLNKSLIVSEGICLPTQTFSTNLSSTPNTCFSNTFFDGTITVTVLGGTPPYTYDNGLRESTWPVFNSLPPGDYTIIVTDANNNQTTNEISVGEGVKKTDHSVSVIYSVLTLFSNFDTRTIKTSFSLSVVPPIPAGTTISVTMNFSDFRAVSSPGTGTISNIIEVKKNGVSIPIVINAPSQVNIPRDDCSNYNSLETTIPKTVTFTLTNGDVLEGSTTSTVDITSPQVDDTTNCSTQLKNDVYLQLLNLTSNCKCCTVTSAENPQLQIMGNTIFATKKTSTTAIPFQLAYSEADCNTACSAGINTYYTFCFSMGPGCELFTDTTLTTKAPVGYYSNYNYCWFFDGDSVVDTRTCALEPPTDTVKYYTADVFRCSPYDCTTPFDNIVVSVDPNYSLRENYYYRDVEYSDFVYQIVGSRGVIGPATRVMDFPSESSDCQACCSITPP